MDVPPIYKRIGSQIARKRKLLGLTQQELSGAIGISRAAVANIERGEQRVFFDQLLQICAFLGLNSVDGLLHVTDDPGERLEATRRQRLSGANLNRRQRSEVREILSELSDV